MGTALLTSLHALNSVSVRSCVGKMDSVYAAWPLTNISAPTSEALFPGLNQVQTERAGPGQSPQAFPSSVDLPYQPCDLPREGMSSRWPRVAVNAAQSKATAYLKDDVIFLSLFFRHVDDRVILQGHIKESTNLQALGWVGHPWPKTIL